MRRSTWPQFPLFMIGLLAIWIGYLVFAPMAWKEWITTQVVKRAAPLLSPKVTNYSEMEALDQWNHLQSAQKEHAGLWMPAVLNQLDGQIPGIDVQQMSTLLGQAQLAQVVFHPTHQGCSVIWVRSLSPVEKGSAVTIGDIFIGYVDLCSGGLARVRLIHDPSCQVSVRAIRPENPLQSLYRDLTIWSDYFDLLQKAQRQPLIDQMNQLRKAIKEVGWGWRSCSKGLLMGSDSTWRHHQNILKGVGFNYVWPDSFVQAPTLIEVGDELVTSGLDGRFPAGLRVARVIETQQEDSAGTYYQLKALPIWSIGNQWPWLWILPPLTETSSKWLDGAPIVRGSSS